MSSKFTQKDLEQYLAGNAPLHPERLALPSEEELDAAEKEFDRFVAKQKQPARLIAFWPFVAAVAAVLVDNGEMKVAFAMYPVSMKQIIDIADTGNIMPPKTTWFEPKLRSGLVIHTLE